MKKIFSCALTLTLSFLLVLPCAAAVIPVDETTVSSDEIYFNEYDYICSLSTATPATLSTLGISETNVTETISTFYTALEKRANESDAALASSGYTEEEVVLLRQYAAGHQLTDAEMRAITGSCTGDIDLTNCGNTTSTFAYTWSWDHSPVITMSDSACMRWLAYDSNAYNIDVIMRSVTTNIDYYNGNTKMFSRTGTREPDLDFNTVNLQFPVSEEYMSNTGYADSAYAKEGRIQVRVSLDNSVTSNIDYILVAGLYGHTTIGIGSPSVSGSLPASISISFTGNRSIENTGAVKAQISNPTSLDYLPV